MAERQGNSHTSIHKALIAELEECHPEIKTSGLWAALRDLPDAEYTQSLLRDDPEWLAQYRFVPDAWVIDPELRAVVLFEVVATHDVPRNKILKMFQLMRVVDQDEYDLILIRCDMTGRRVYDLQGLSILDLCEGVDRGAPASSPLTHFWQYYTAERTEARLTRLTTGGARGY